MLYRLDVHQELDSQLVINSWHVNCASPPTDAQLQTFITNTHERFLDRQSADLRANFVTARRVDITGTMSRTFVPAGWPKVGEGLTVDGLPGFCAVLLKGVSLDGQKPGRLRKFIAGVREDETDAGKLSGTAQTTWDAIAGAIEAWNNTEPDVPVVAVQYSIGPDPVAGPFNQIEFWSVSNNVAIMSRRKIGRGR